MNLQTLCIPRDSVFAADRRATVLNLDAFLKGQIHGADFFEENYFTNGMLMLVDRAFRHLSATGAGSSVFLQSQAMGGGKTHSMIGLGLLARDPELRRKVLYLEYAVAVSVGSGDLGLVTTTALVNLFSAAAEMENVCLVISDLAGTNYSVGQQKRSCGAAYRFRSETDRGVPITPVNPNGDKRYHILRKRLFQNLCS